jgi:CheY-like chemotaxis protein
MDESTRPSHPDSDKLVLVVDAERGVRDLLEHALPSFGFRVATAADGEQAIEQYRRCGDVGVVLCGVRLDLLDGPAVLRALKQLDPEVRFCFMTGAGAERRQELLALGARAVFAKPFRLAELADGLRHALAGGPERRCRSRFPSPLPSEVAVGGRSAQAHVRAGGDAAILDVSEAGARLGVDAPMTKGEEIDLLLLGPTQRRPVQASGNVVWCVEQADGSYRAGVRFRQLLSNDELSSLI